MKKKILKVISYIILFFLLVILSGRILMPKYNNRVVEGSLIDDYYEIPKGKSVLFIGDCEMYSSINPVRIWKELGVSSAVRATPNQTMGMSYYILKEALLSETPDIVVLSCLSLSYDERIKESYNRLTFDYMKNSLLKYEAIKNCTDDDVLSYIFPVIRYHDRALSLKGDDFTDLFGNSVSYMGYLPNTNVKAYTTFPTPQPLPSYDFPKTNVEYLDKIAKLCKNKKVQLVLIKVPSLYPYWYEEWDDNTKKLADDLGIRYVNYLDHVDEIGLDYSLDTYDGGYHLNLTGAWKFTGFLMKDLDLDSIKKDYSKSLEDYYNLRCEDYDKAYQ